jgi:hypothetical protein
MKTSFTVTRASEFAPGSYLVELHTDQPGNAKQIAAMLEAYPAALDALRQARAALATLADEAGDVPIWNDGGEAREAAQAVRAVLAAHDSGQAPATRWTAQDVTDAQCAAILHFAGPYDDADRAAVAADLNGTNTPRPPTRADLDTLAATHGIRVSPDARAGCFNLYWPDGAHAFAVSVRDAIDTIRFNVRQDESRNT